jgi:putative PIN family toxin of toxin-antitoxin system
MIVVIDTNVAVSGLHFAGRAGIPAQAIAKAADFDMIATADAIDSELIRILTERFNWSDLRVRKEMQYMLRRAIRVNITGTLRVCRDPDDDKFLECAERADADLLISGDKDLLALRRHGRTRIVTPAAYLKG